MKNRKNLLLVALLLVVVAIASASTFAWLTDTNSANGGTYTVGDVSYTITAPEDASGTVVPGQNLAGPTIKNASNVVSNLRVKFTISVDVTGASNTSANKNWTIGTDDDDHLFLTLGSKWFEDDGYYYYGSVNDDKTTGGAEDIAATQTTIESLFSSLVINGKVVGNDYSGAKVTISITYEAKQAEYVQWSELATFNFETGIA